MKKLEINLTEKTYPLYVKKGVFKEIGKEIKNIYNNKKIAVITDSNVDKFYGEYIERSLMDEDYLVKKIVIKSGENSKSVESLLKLYDELLDFGINRGDMIIALGGGVVGDLVGFTASTFLRGTPFIQIPTTLLAQVDSSIGGKVAVNLPKGKNLIGNFYHPEAVFIDPNFILTLEPKFFADGMAEVIKYGCIRDRELFSKLLNYKDKEELFEDIEYIIYTCCSIKKHIVENDEKDLGERMLLNFGHTIGHAVEKYFNFETYTHGEGVAIGMYSITKNSEELGITEAGTADKILKIINKYDLPHSIKAEDSDKFMSIIGRDKKNIGKSLNIILLKSIGESFINKIDPEDASKYLKV